MSDTEKVTVNLSVVDLGQIDLLASEGFYSNRTDFIRTAIRNQLSAHAEIVKQSVVRNHVVVGIVNYTRQGLERHVAKKEQLAARVLGMLVIDDDVSKELAIQAFESIRVYGVLRASTRVKEALADRIH